ncbi:MAG: InlB B-repeat-containing protein [Treponema sp.]|nr:InlB B-repeat-containing protein [Treponema sp.]
MTKTGFRARLGRKTPAIAAAFVMAMVLAGCPGNGLGPDPEPGPGPGTGTGTEMFTVTFDRNFEANQGQGAAPTARTVAAGTVITLPGRGNMNRDGHVFGGWNTQADGEGTPHAAAADFTVSSTVTLFARWVELEPITISVTGVPSGISHMEITLTNQAGDLVGSGNSQSIIGGTATFQINALPGTHNIRLSHWGISEQIEWRSINPLLITVDGPNSFYFDTDFEKLVPITITVTGVDAHFARIELLNQAGNVVASGETQIQDGSAEFIWLNYRYVGGRFMTPGAYEVRLRLMDDGWDIISVHRIDSISISPGNNEIGFGEFDEMPPIKVTVTGVPAEFHGYWGMLVLMSPGGNMEDGGAMILQADTAFTVFGVFPGTFDVVLAIMDGDTHAIVGARTASSRTIAAGGSNNITWSDFTDMLLTRMTISGIPADYEGAYAEVLVRCLVSDEEIAFGGGTVTDGYVLITLFDSTGWFLDRTVSGQVTVFFEGEIYHPDWGSSWTTIGAYATTATITFPHGQNTTVQWSAFNIDIGGTSDLSAPMGGPRARAAR